MSEREWTAEAFEYLLDDGRPRRCWLRSIDVRHVMRAVVERESRSWWQSAYRLLTAVLGVFLP